MSIFPAFVDLRGLVWGVTSLPAAFSVKLGKLPELSYTKNGLFVMLG